MIQQLAGDTTLPNEEETAPLTTEDTPPSKTEDTVPPAADTEATLQTSSEDGDKASRPSRHRNLTMKGRDLYEENLTTRQKSIAKAKKTIKAEINAIENCGSIEDLHDVETALVNWHAKFESNANLALGYCKALNTVRSRQQAAELRENIVTLQAEVTKAHHRIQEEISKIIDADDTRSLVSQKFEHCSTEEGFSLLRATQYVADQNKNEKEAQRKQSFIQDRPYDHREIPSGCTERHIDQTIPVNLSKFLMKKEIMVSRLMNFDESPESYMLWKDNFLIAIREFDVSPAEEINLLVRYLGPESSRYAMSIRASTVRYPERGLQKIWQRLDERYGCPELIEAALKRRLENFQMIDDREPSRLYDLADLLSEIEAVMENEELRAVLSFYNSSTGIMPIVRKLPYSLQEKWVSHAADYKRRWRVSFPPFSVFVSFVHEMGRVKNDPSLQVDPLDHRMNTVQCTFGNTVISSVKKTELRKLSPVRKNVGLQFCPLHKSIHHGLTDCIAFRQLTVPDRRDILKLKGYCYSCFTRGHVQRECSQRNECEICGKTSHHTLLHENHGEEQVYIPTHIQDAAPTVSSKTHGEERTSVATRIQDEMSTSSTCTQRCGHVFTGKSCSKVILVKIYDKHQPHSGRLVYAILDDQSNRSLIRSDLLDQLEPPTEILSYTMNSCNGQKAMQGRQATGLVVESYDGSTQHALPTVLECDQIPNDREEIPTPDVAQHYSHLTSIARHIPEENVSAPISLLIGRDAPEFHHVHDQKIDNKNLRAPYAQRLSLGWVIVGETCLGRTCPTTKINVNKISVMRSDRLSTLTPGTDSENIREDPDRAEACTVSKMNDITSSVFLQTSDDEKLSLSNEDKGANTITCPVLARDDTWGCFAPQPFLEYKPKLTNSRNHQDLERVRNLTASLDRVSVKVEQLQNFMNKVFENGHGKDAPNVDDCKDVWYLPVFGVYHPKKLDQIRHVLDASAKYQGVPLNDMLLSGPDLSNRLPGIFHGCRHEQLPIIADFQRTFHHFKVREELIS